ncbi:hypothetical protein MTR67_023974 [Solanum verrucosum]|uniref:Uncharacterized protein n=1 Tax=Solanum verrucosum TaxID=315347 RepID=A0AAF0R2Y4_SOLVR|nr:hypothetical protein MTR67_023974 [Solanum verrucosum]
MVSPSSNAETIHLSLINAASFVSIKLSGRSNYIPWRAQIVCLLQSHDLLGFVDGTNEFPQQTIASADEPAKEEGKKGDGIEPPKEEEEKRDEIEPSKEEEEEKGDEIEPAKEEEEEKGDGIFPPKEEEKKGDGIEPAKEEEEEKGDEIEPVKEEEEKGDGIEPPKEEEKKGDEIRNKEDYLQRKRSDELVKACIFGSLSDQLLQDRAIHRLDTARRVWLVLKRRYAPNPPGRRTIDQIEHIALNDYRSYLPLFRALLSRDWEKAETFLNAHGGANIASINIQLQTALHLAVGVKSENGNTNFIEKLVASIENSEDLAIRDCFGETALHYAARFGNLDAAKILVDRYPGLPYIGTTDGLYPIHHAARYGHVSRDVFIHFLRFNENRAPYTDYSGVKLLYRLVESNLYGSSGDANNMWDRTVGYIRETGKEVLGVSMVTFGGHEGDGGRMVKLKAKWKQNLVETYPDLAKHATDGIPALKNLANREFTFVRGSHPHFWKQLLYCRVPIRSTSRSLQRRPNANDLENDSQMVKTKYRRIYFSMVINKLHTLLFVVLEFLGNISHYP